MEYRVLYVPKGFLQKQLNELAAEGWHVVFATEKYIIMCRPKPD